MRRPELTAIIYNKRGDILSIGKNSYVKTHPLQARYARQVGDPTKIYLHAEISAIVRCRSDGAYRIAIFRYGKGGEARNARPCVICEQAIKEFGIKKVEHT
jgi:deoxycytidylate deaminase